MKLTEQERALGLMVVTCKCCGNAYKAHEASNSLTYSMEPNYGCDECEGVSPINKNQYRGMSNNVDAQKIFNTTLSGIINKGEDNE